MMTEHLKSRYYFVDEAGTPVIWGRRKKDVVIGKSESRYFIMGLAEVRDVTSVSNGVDHLRNVILKDPQFAGIASLHPDKKKTAIHFHAKDDHPVVRDQAVLDSIRKTECIDSSYRYKPNNLYDALVRRLFSGRLHHDHSRYSIYFAQRDKSDRQAALLAALKNAQKDYELYAGVDEKQPSIRFISGYPKQYQGLQIVDYCNWALQRFYERGENHYWKQLWDAGKVRCVVDLDDTARYPGGEIYSSRNPLTGMLRWS